MKKHFPMIKRPLALLLLLAQLTGMACAAEPATATDFATRTDLATATDLVTTTDQPEEEPELLPPADLPEAEDLTQACLFNGYPATSFKDMCDGKYKSFYTTVPRSGAHAVYVTVPEGKEARGLVVKLRDLEPYPVAVQVQDEAGEWRTIGATSGKFIEEYCRFPAAASFRIVCADNPKQRMRICELTVLSEGSLPASVHIWEEAPEDIDLLMLTGHPDDEILWFAGMLPYYAGERHKKVLVACAAFNIYYRRQELLDCLWTCGVRIYPLFLGLQDMVNANAEFVLGKWGKGKTIKKVTLMLRQYRPKVLMLHADGGETNHGVHKALNRLGKQCTLLAADPEEYPDTLPAYEVPKVYVHLQQENAIRLDWHVPLAAFGGRTALDVATEAYTHHLSQQHKSWYFVVDDGERDSSLYGLWRTTVGPDTVGGDLFENLE